MGTTLAFLGLIAKCIEAGPDATNPSSQPQKW